MVPSSLSQVLSSSPDTLGGEVCFTATRVPVRILFDHVNRGISVDVFFEDYPSVPRQSVMQVLNWERDVAIKILDQPAGHFATA